MRDITILTNKSMTNLDNLIKSAFGLEEIKAQEKDNLEEFVYKCNFEYKGLHDKQALDSLYSIVQGNDALIFEYNNSDSPQSISKGDYAIIKDTETDINVSITIKINKSISNGAKFVYSIPEFEEYFNNLSLLDCYNVASKEYGDGLRKIILLFYNREICYRSASFKICSVKDDNYEIYKELNSQNTRNNMIENCHWDDEQSAALLPEAFLFHKEKGEECKVLEDIFDKLCFYQTIRFLFNYTTLSRSEFKYHISGYKTISGREDTSVISRIERVDKINLQNFYKIYKWVYDSGNVSDKMGIARNIMTINSVSNKLSLSDETIESIHSNFNIYNQANIAKYIEVRNKLSETFLNLQLQMNRVADEYVSDFNKNIAAILTFFISVIVLKVVAKVDTYTGFSLAVILIGMVFLIVSWFIKDYSRKAYNEKMSMLEKYISNLKSRYKEILSKDETEKLFSEVSDLTGSESSITSSESYKQIVGERVSRSERIWKWLIILLFGILAVLLFIQGLDEFATIDSCFHYSMSIIKMIAGGICLFVELSFVILSY